MLLRATLKVKIPTLQRERSRSSNIYFSILFFYLSFFFLQNVGFVVRYKLRFAKEQLLVPDYPLNLLRRMDAKDENASREKIFLYRVIISTYKKTYRKIAMFTICAKESRPRYNINYTMASRFSGRDAFPIGRSQRAETNFGRAGLGEAARDCLGRKYFPREREQRMDNSPIKSNLTRTEYKLGNDTFCG